MSVIMPKEQKTEFETTPQGTHLGVCYRVVDLGTQPNIFKPGTTQHKIMLSWEFPEEKMTDGRPFSIHKKYTLSSNEKATLRLHLEAWRGKAFTDDEFGSFDLGKLIGVPCLINVLHKVENGNTFANVSAIMKTHKGQVVPPLTNEAIYFSLNAFDQTLFDKLSENIRHQIQQSPEYHQIKGPKQPNEAVLEDDDRPPIDVPF